MTPWVSGNSVMQPGLGENDGSSRLWRKHSNVQRPGPLFHGPAKVKAFQ